MERLLEVDESTEDLGDVLLPNLQLVVKLLPLWFTERPMYRSCDGHTPGWLIHLGVDRFRPHDCTVNSCRS